MGFQNSTERGIFIWDKLPTYLHQTRSKYKIKQISIVKSKEHTDLWKVLPEVENR